jgi:hypothetical protein
MAVTVAEFVQGSDYSFMGTEISAYLPVYMDQIIDLSQIANPTLQLSWQFKEYAAVDTRGNFDIRFTWGASNNVHYWSGNDQQLTINPEDHFSRMTATPRLMYSATGFSAMEQARYANSIFDLPLHRTLGCNRAFTEVLNYEQFASQGSTNEVANVNSQDQMLDLDGIILDNLDGLGWAQHGVKLGFSDIGGVTAVSSRVASLPTLIRPHIGSGHTIQGISTENNIWWRSPVRTARGTAGGEPALPSNAYIDTTVTDVTRKNIIQTDTDGSPVNPTLSDLRYVPNNMQTGSNFPILAVTSTPGLAYITQLLLNFTATNASDPLLDFGVTYMNHIKDSAFNVCYYADPIMDRLWPNSVMYYDIQQIPLVCVDGWGPRIQEWKEVPLVLAGTYAMVKIMWMQRVLKHARAIGWLLNCKWY